MKILIYLLAVNSILLNVNAQVKIGATGNPDVDAVLELASSSKGLLLPRLTLTNASNPSPLSAFVAGMVVYNTANVSDVRPGYYYSDGIKWIRLSNSLETWALGGNAATDPLTQFLGTTDSTDLSLRTDNIERIRITSSGSIEIGTSFENSKLKLGGIMSGHLASLFSITGQINPTDNTQLLYSFKNAPQFGTGFKPNTVIGTATEFSYSGGASYGVFGELADILTYGPNSYGGVAAVFGSVTRSSAGIADGSYYGGFFQSLVAGDGNLDDAVAISGTVSLNEPGATTISNVGGLRNFIINNNPNSTLSTIYGIRNVINQNVSRTVPSVAGVENLIQSNSGAILSQCYGTLTTFSAGTGTITNAYGHYLGSVSVSSSIVNYRGIYIGDIASGAGTRYAFEYAGAGTNDPVVINYNGSVQIGTNTPVPNAKLSIVDGHLQSGQTIKPTISANSNMGTGATATLNDATDIAGIIDLDLGSGAWSSGPQATITFNKVYTNSPIVIITPANTAAATGVELQRPHVTTNATSFTISFGAAATNGNMMRFNYHVIETVNN